MIYRTRSEVSPSSLTLFKHASVFLFVSLCCFSLHPYEMLSGSLLNIFHTSLDLQNCFSLLTFIKTDLQNKSAKMKMKIFDNLKHQKRTKETTGTSDSFSYRFSFRACLYPSKWLIYIQVKVKIYSFCLCFENSAYHY